MAFGYLAQALALEEVALGGGMAQYQGIAANLAAYEVGAPNPSSHPLASAFSACLLTVCASAVSHPSRKNKDMARMAPPVLWAMHFLLCRGKLRFVGQRIVSIREIAGTRPGKPFHCVPR